MHLLRMEFYKLRHQKMGVMIGGLALFQVFYIIWATRGMDTHELGQSWKSCLYTVFQLNIIIMPICIAMIASRLSDMEHKGSTFKYLKTIVSGGKLFHAKILCGAIYLMMVVGLQMVIMLGISQYRNFMGALPISQLGYYIIITFMIDLTLLILQLNLSLLITNQMVALMVAIVGTFLGLYSMFFSEKVGQWILWGYYALLAPVRMDWDPVTRVTDFYWIQLPIKHLVILLGISLILYGVGKSLFVRREQ